MTLRDEKKYLANKTAAYTYYVKGIQAKKQKILELGNLVLIRNHAVDSLKRQKLKAKWLELRTLVLYSAFKLMRYIYKIYSDSKAKKYHLNNILLYQERSNLFVNRMYLIVRPKDTISTVIREKEIGKSERQSFILYNK